MEKPVDLLRRLLVDLRHGGQRLHVRRHDLFNGAEFAHQRPLSRGADSRDLIQPRGRLRLTAQGAVVFDREAVRLVLHARDQLKSLTVPVDGDLLVVKIQPSCAVMVVLDHAADRNVEPQLVQHFQGDIENLLVSTSLIHA